MSTTPTSITRFFCAFIWNHQFITNEFKHITPSPISLSTTPTSITRLFYTFIFNRQFITNKFIYHQHKCPANLHLSPGSFLLISILSHIIMIIYIAIHKQSSYVKLSSKLSLHQFDQTIVIIMLWHNFHPSMTMTSNNPSINISVATKYLDPGERGAQVIIKVLINMMTVYLHLFPVVGDQVLTQMTQNNNIKTNCTNKHLCCDKVPWS